MSYPIQEETGLDADVSRTPGSATVAFLDHLVDLSALLERRESVDETLHELAALFARSLNAKNCSIMLIKETRPDGTLTLRVSTHAGNLPHAAYEESRTIRSGIAHRVAMSGRPLLVRDIATSGFAAMASRSADAEGGFISVPIKIDGTVIGVINVNSPTDGRVFSDSDLQHATILSMYVGKSIQVIYLKNIMKSRFTVAALEKEQRKKRARSGTFTQEPDKVAKLLAKSFFNEMKQAGMGPDHILNAATEIIDQLHGTLARHKAREARVREQPSR